MKRATFSPNEPPAGALPSSEKPNVLVAGTSSPVGASCARYLSASGYRVFELDRPGFGRDGAARWSGARAGGSEDAPRAFDQEQIAAFVLDRIWNRHGPLRAVVNCFDHRLIGPVEETTPQEARALFEANTGDVLSVCRAVLPLMRERREGLIVNVGFDQGAAPRAFHGAYRASRSAMESLTGALRDEVAPFGIDVTLVRARATADSRASRKAPARVARRAQRRSAYGERFQHARSVAESGRVEASSNSEASRQRLENTGTPCPEALLIERLIRRAGPAFAEGDPATSEKTEGQREEQRRPGPLFREVRAESAGNLTSERPSGEAEGGPFPESEKASSEKAALPPGLVTFTGTWDKRSREEVREAIAARERTRLHSTDQTQPGAWTCTARPPAQEQRGAYTAHRHGSSAYGDGACFCAETSRALATRISGHPQNAPHAQQQDAAAAAPANLEAAAR